MSEKNIESSGMKSVPVIVQSEGVFNAGIILTESNYDVWSQLVAGERRRGEYSTLKSRKCVWYLSGKCGERRKYCLLWVENGMGVAT